MAQLAALDADGWFDYWHAHPDILGRANRARPMVASLTCRLLQQAEERVSSRRDPVQVWATLCENTANNAVYIHSPNPNGTPFPNVFAGVAWGVEPVEDMGLVTSGHEIGKWVHEGEVVYFIRARQASHPLHVR